MIEITPSRQARIERVMRTRRQQQRAFLSESFSGHTSRRRSNKILAAFAIGIVFLIIGAILAMAAGVEPGKQEPAFIEFSGGVAGTWLRVERHNVRDPEARSFDPSYVSVVSDFKPVCKKLPNGRWEIQFVTELPK